MKLFLSILLFSSLIYSSNGLESLQPAASTSFLYEDDGPPSPRSVVSALSFDSDEFHRVGYWELIAEISSRRVESVQGDSESAVDEIEFVLFK